MGKYAKQIGGYAVTDATKLAVASGNFGVGVLKSAVVPATKATDTPAKEAEDPSKEISQGGREDNAAQTSVETDAPANEADADVTQTVVQSSEARSVGSCKRKLHNRH
ncbi:hypothetical protein P3T76_015471 [Phytophthora citrophthora]|uniref:Uncharacterized protein n=1 Tax=Phytophthora citrophthora TaxID=4793 RepID=A0AAD9LA77_9STRA|nr:hypothetical protein P3T76_015471 [Phytophthora citrophthora]